MAASSPDSEHFSTHAAAQTLAFPLRGVPSTLTDRLVQVFANVRSDELWSALLMLLNLFLAMTGYYVLKVAREPLILATAGAELKSYAAACQAAALLVGLPVYGWLTTRLHRFALIRRLIIFFVLCLQVFAFAAAADTPLVGFVFYVWLGIFSLTIIAQFWAFANDIYDQEAGERIFPLIAVGANAGALAGALLSVGLYRAKLGSHTLLAVASGILLLHLAIYITLQRRAACTRYIGPPRLVGQGGFRLLLNSRYLRLIALLLLLLNLVNTTGEYIMGKLVTVDALQMFAKAAAVDPALARSAFLDNYIGAFYARLDLIVSVASVALQAVVTSRIVKHAGIAGALLALPVIATGAYGLVAAGAGLSIVRWAKTAENATDYSLMNTARALLWLPTSADEKYKAKLTIDTLVVRFGDVLSAAVVFIGTVLLGIGPRGFGAFNLGMVALWLALAWLVTREYRRLAQIRDAAAATSEHLPAQPNGQNPVVQKQQV